MESKIFSMTDEKAYSNLPKYAKFFRALDLSSGDCCHDKVIYYGKIDTTLD